MTGDDSRPPDEAGDDTHPPSEAGDPQESGGSEEAAQHAATPGPERSGTAAFDGEELETAWVRPGEQPVRQFHEFTSLWLFEGVSGSGGGDDGLTFFPRPPADAPLGTVGRAIGVAFRWLLAHSVVVVLLAAAGLAAYGALSPAVGGIGVFFPEPVRAALSVLAVDAVLWALVVLLLGWLFAVGEAGSEDVGLAGALEGTVAILSPFVVYGGFAALAAGTALSTYLVWSRSAPALAPNVVYASGFLLLLYVGGPLVYDGLVRTESLVERLTQTGLVDPATVDSYDPFKDRVAAMLNSHVLGLPTAVLIAVAFVGQFVLFWLRGAGPFALGVVPTLVFVSAVDVIIVVVAVQFVVLVKALNELLDDDTGSDVRLVYRPAHEDGVGGFRDLGQFATRVNTLLLLAGLYLAYRLHVQGLRDPMSPFAPDPDPGRTLLWALSYALPVLVYVAVIGVWSYYSFWQLHRKMVREKSHRIRAGTHTPGRDDLAELDRWEAFENAPEWPIRYRLLVTIVSMDVLSVLLGAVSLL